MKKTPHQRTETELASLTKQLHDVNERLDHMSSVDSLTGLLNRRGLQEVLSKELPKTLQEGAKILALLVDLDDFQRINEIWGLSAGDILLNEVGRRIKKSVRPGDYVARMDGDEFMVVMPHMSLSHGAEMAERIRLAVSGDPISNSQGRGIHVTASLGMVHITNGSSSVEEILDKTYLILQHSKKGGKNRLSYASNGRSGTRDSRAVSGLLLSLSQPESYRVVVQPIVDLTSEKPVGYELLCRSTIREFEFPDDFFRVCMENNLLTLADHYCLRACMKTSAAWPPGVRRHVNLFPSTLISIPVQQLLEEMSFNPVSKSCCVEISEKQIIGDPTTILGPVRALKKAGIQIAIDDVGYGRTCLESLTILEPEIIKIDTKSITGIGQNPSMIRPLQHLLKITDILGADAIAEGIETESDWKTLRDLGVKQGQGYLWGKPASKIINDLSSFRRSVSHYKKSA
jgi:diguanylate cyclase (GGDEF)-like protein